MKQLNLIEEMPSLQKALNEIHFFKGNIPIKAYEVLISHQNEITVHLIKIIEKVILRHNLTGDYYNPHIHALLLLGQFREKQAYPLVMQLLSLPRDSIERLLGDMLTETIPKIITSIYDGNPVPLFTVLINSSAEDILRLVIGTCFSALIYQKMLDKEMFILRLQEIIAEGKMNEDRAFFTVLADMTMRCRLEPLYDTVRASFNADMVLNHIINKNLFEKNLLCPIEKTNSLEHLNPLTDAAKELEKWYAYGTPITPKIARNTRCPCGSGHKFKNCCSYML